MANLRMPRKVPPDYRTIRSTSSSVNSSRFLFERTGPVATIAYAQDQETNGGAAETQRRIPPPPIATNESGCEIDQSDTERLGEYFVIGEP